MSHPNADLIERLYGAMDKHDGETMAACYAPDAHFHDPVFGDLTGTQAGAMWKMLTSRSADLKVELPEHAADDATGSAHWIATYTFGDTGRTVVNDIHASFQFRDGLIVRHVDEFSFWKWSRQALGLPGLLLGWTPILRKKVSGGALERLRAEPGGA
jgi:ketosteroid isomerase-like protein